jgi:hypothetical protein
MVENYPTQPLLFYCEECKLYFFTTSKMKKPTHPKCFGHKTRIATDEEIDAINEFNNTQYAYNNLEINLKKR